MSFQAYLDNIQHQTGIGPDQFVTLATDKGLTAPGTKATAITDWLKPTMASGTATPWPSSSCSGSAAG